MSSCCHPPAPQAPLWQRFDYMLWGSVTLIVMVLAAHFSNINYPPLHSFAHGLLSLLGTMWWGVAIGIIIVGIMNKVPREYFQLLLGRGDNFMGLIRAAIAGLLLDLCSHGILMVGAKLYERGTGIAQVMTFLIASPWNSFSLTIILISLIGLPWTLVFIMASFVIAVISGLIFQALVRNGLLQENPKTPEVHPSFDWRADMRTRWNSVHFTPKFFLEIVMGGLPEARMLLRWVLVGVIIAAATRAFIPTDWFAYMFGPTIFGLFMTLIAATAMEVCSEGSAPIAAEIFTRAAAAGNAFTFLMAGVATDATEILVLRQVTKSWKIALCLPLVTVPQVLIIAYFMNGFG